MNKVRRTSLAALANEVDEIASQVQTDLDNDGESTIDWDATIGDIENLKDKAGDLKDEEQEYYDNMPSGLQSGDKGETAQSAVSELESAESDFDDAISECNAKDHQCVIDALETARDHINDAAA